LITAQRNAPAAIDKRVSSVGDNQDALVKAIESSSIQTRQFLLDGHFCVFDTSDSIQRVPLQTFKTLAPVGVILLFDEVKRIQERLEKRERRKFSLELLESLQQAELEHADKVCKVLNIPLCSVAATEHDNAHQFALRCFAKTK
jgi:adenylate kinase